MSLVSAKRERFRIDIRHSKNQELFGDKRKYNRDIMLQDEQIQMQQANDFLNSQLKNETMWQKEHVCRYIAQNYYLNQSNIQFDGEIEIMIFRWLIQSPNLMQNHIMYDILLRCFYNIRNKLNLEEMDFIAGVMMQKLCHSNYTQSTLNILLRLTNQYELTLFFKVMSQEKYMLILMELNCLDTLKILSNIVCENYFDEQIVEQLIAYFIKYIDNYNAIEALTTISDDKRYIMYLNKYFYLFQEDDDRMVIVINFFNHYMTSIDQLMHNLLDILKYTTNRNAQLKIWYQIYLNIQKKIGSTFDPTIQHLLWQNKGYLEQLAEDENLASEVRDLINQIFDYLESIQA